MRARIVAARADLARLPVSYQRGLILLGHPTVLIPSSARTDGHRRTGKPDSQPPAGADTVLRTALVASTQRLAEAVRTLMAWDWPDDYHPWQPDGIAYTTAKGQTILHADGNVAWRDPADLTTRLLPAHEVTVGVARARRILADLAASEWPDLDDPELTLTPRQRADAAWDRDTVAAALRSAKAAVGELRWAGVWKAPPPPVPDEQRCLHCDDRAREPDRKWCSACRRAHQPDRLSCRVCGLAQGAA